MSRSRFAQCLLVSSAVALASSCQAPYCGPGTKQVQLSNGDVRCEAADNPDGGLLCPLDAGSVIQAGVCVPHVQCDPATTTYDPVSGLCIGMGTARVRGEPPACPPTSGNNFCLNGAVYHAVDNTVLAASEHVRVRLFLSPLSFLTDPTMDPTQIMADAEVDSDDLGTYIFPSVPVPAQGLIAIATLDQPTATPTLQMTAVGGQSIVSGQSYTIDTRVVPKSVVASWSAGSGGIDYAAKGAYVMEFYCHAALLPNKVILKGDTTPTMGVSAFQDGVAAPMVRYLGPGFDMISTGATATVATGTALVAGDGNLHPSNTGMGGSCAIGSMWEDFPGGTRSGAVLITRFHRK